MKALVDLTSGGGWQTEFTGRPWFLLPVANRIAIGYWLEFCVDVGVDEVHFLIDHQGASLEKHIHDGSEWGLKATYGFNASAGSKAFLKRNPEKWLAGLLYVRGFLFPARTEAFDARKLDGDMYGYLNFSEGGSLFVSNNSERISDFINSDLIEGRDAFVSMGMSPREVESTKDYFDLNMEMIKGEISRYLGPGYFVSKDGSRIGSNTIISPSVKFKSPVVMGDNCKLFAMVDAGPNIVLENRVVVDNQAELSNCIVLSNSYIGQGIQIRNKIVAGKWIIDLESGAVVSIASAWVLDDIEKVRPSFFRFAGWLFQCFLVLLILIVQSPAILIMWALGNWRVTGKKSFLGEDKELLTIQTRGSRSESGLASRLNALLWLDMTPLFLCVLQHKLSLFGCPRFYSKDDEGWSELPKYFPGAISYEDARSNEQYSSEMRIIDALYRSGHNSIRDDLALLRMFARSRVSCFFGKRSNIGGKEELSG